MTDRWQEFRLTNAYDGSILTAHTPCGHHVASITSAPTLGQLVEQATQHLSSCQQWRPVQGVIYDDGRSIEFPAHSPHRECIKTSQRELGGPTHLAEILPDGDLVYRLT